MLWFAVHLPRLSFEAFAATLPPQPGGRPLALLAGHGVQAVDAVAAAAGVQPGLKRATALALAPTLCFGQADAARDEQALHAVAYAGLAFTPAVAIEGHTVLLEVAASLRCFGGADALLARLRGAIAPLGHQVQIASAPTALGAALLARWRDDLADGPHRSSLTALRRLLDEAPIALLCAPGAGFGRPAPRPAAGPSGRARPGDGPGLERWQAMQGMGLHRLADLRRLPRAGVARRFGQSLLDEIDRARGEQPDPREWIVAPECFEARLELAMRADRSEPLLHAASLLLARLVAWAQSRHARVQAFVLRMHHERRHRAGSTTPPLTSLRIELAEPAAELDHLQRLLRERLARLELAAPTLEIELRCRELVQQPAPNAELFPTRQSQGAGLARLIETLAARLGDGQVLRLQAVADHRPEQASRTVPALAAAAAGGAAAPRAWPAGVPEAAAASTAMPVADGLLSRPAWLLPQPQPLAERQAMPLLDGRPLQLLVGPERIETGWWDGGLALRDYFIAQAADGSLVWIYRARLPVADEAEPLWFLQGRFG